MAEGEEVQIMQTIPSRGWLTNTENVGVTHAITITHLAPDQSLTHNHCPSRAPLPASCLCSIHRPSLAGRPRRNTDCIPLLRNIQWKNRVLSENTSLA